MWVLTIKFATWLLQMFLPDRLFTPGNIFSGRQFLFSVLVDVLLQIVMFILKIIKIFIKTSIYIPVLKHLASTKTPTFLQLSRNTTRTICFGTLPTFRHLRLKLNNFDAKMREFRFFFVICAKFR